MNNELMLKNLKDAESKIQMTLFRNKEFEYNYEGLIKAIHLIQDFQSQIYKKEPELNPINKIPYDRELTDEEENFCLKLSSEELEKIDKLVISKSTREFKKVARVVADVLDDENIPNSIPDVFISQRIQFLYNKCILERQGDLKRMRYSEIKLKYKS